jgi:hypothetical protein
VARARNIKPSFFTNDVLAEIDPLGRLLFQGLWCIADREGRLEDRPKKIKAEVLPYDDCDVEELLNTLNETGFILRYESGEKRFIQVVNFCKHQNPHVKEAASTIPAPYKNSTSTAQEQSEHKGNDGQAEELPEQAGLIPDSLNLIPDSLIPSEKQEPYGSVDSGAKAAPTADLLGEHGAEDLIGEQSEPGIPACPVQQIVSLYHACMPENPKVKVLDDARKKAIRARWKQAAQLEDVGPFGYSNGKDGLDAWKAFFEVCADSDFLTGKARAQPGKPPFVANIDFLMSPSGFKNTVENKYHREVKEQ